MEIEEAREILRDGQGIEERAFAHGFLEAHEQWKEKVKPLVEALKCFVGTLDEDDPLMVVAKEALSKFKGEE